MDNVNKIAPQENKEKDVSPIVSEFLSKNLESIEQVKNKAYDLEDEFAKTKKNKSLRIIFLIIISILLVAGITAGTAKLLNNQTRNISLDISDFDDINLKNLLDLATKTQESLEQASQKLAILEGNMNTEIENEDIALKNKISAINASLISEKDKSTRRNKAKTNSQKIKDEISKKYASDINILKSEITTLQDQMSKFDATRIEESEKQKVLLDSKEQLFENEKKQIQKENAEMIADLENTIQKMKKDTDILLQENTKSLSEGYQKRISNLDPRLQDSKANTILSNINIFTKAPTESVAPDFEPATTGTVVTDTTGPDVADAPTDAADSTTNVTTGSDVADTTTDVTAATGSDVAATTTDVTATTGSDVADATTNVTDTTGSDVAYSTTDATATTGSDVTNATTNVANTTGTDIADATTNVAATTGTEIADSTTKVADTTDTDIADATTNVAATTGTDVADTTEKVSKKKTDSKNVERSNIKKDAENAQYLISKLATIPFENGAARYLQGITTLLNRIQAQANDSISNQSQKVGSLEKENKNLEKSINTIKSGLYSMIRENEAVGIILETNKTSAMEILLLPEYEKKAIEQTFEIYNKKNKVVGTLSIYSQDGTPMGKLLQYTDKGKLSPMFTFK